MKPPAGCQARVGFAEPQAAQPESLPQIAHKQAWEQAGTPVAGVGQGPQHAAEESPGALAPHTPLPAESLPGRNCGS